LIFCFAAIAFLQEASMIRENLVLQSLCLVMLLLSSVQFFVGYWLGHRRALREVAKKNGH
jgi:hypothetical protein